MAGSIQDDIYLKWNDKNLEGMTKIQKEWQKTRRNDSNTEGMTIMRKEWHKVFFWKKEILAQIFFQLALLSPLGHKEVIAQSEKSNIFFLSLTWTPPGTPGVSKDAPLSTKLGFGGLVL